MMLTPFLRHFFRPVGSGKTALMLELCRTLSKNYSIACVTNDIFTTEDTDFLIRNKALEDPERIVAIETGKTEGQKRKNYSPPPASYFSFFPLARFRG